MRPSLVHLVSSGAEGFQVTSLPMVVDREVRCLAGHFARASSHWRGLRGSPVIVIAVASESYITPSWYPSNEEAGGSVVPTWNYEAVHVHGVAHLHEDKEWLISLVRQLSEVHESRRTDPAGPWYVDNTPASFVEQQLAGIVGVSVLLDRVEAKQKLSANRSTADQTGVVAGLPKLEVPRSE